MGPCQGPGLGGDGPSGVHPIPRIGVCQFFENDEANTVVRYPALKLLQLSDIQGARSLC